MLGGKRPDSLRAYSSRPLGRGATELWRGKNANYGHRRAPARGASTAYAT